MTFTLSPGAAHSGPLRTDTAPRRPSTFFIPHVVQPLRQRDQHTARVGDPLFPRGRAPVVSTRFHSSEIFDAAP